MSKACSQEADRTGAAYPYTFTVLTPTYNRAHTLSRVYESLKAQTCQSFEWLIVDDGSTDETAALIQEWEREADFPIRYTWQENAGKHLAINRGVQEARGQLFLILDSDDACVAEALERFKSHWDSIPPYNRHEFTGVTCLARDPDGNLVGTPFPADPLDSNSLEVRYRYNVQGEKWGFHRTEVLKEFPFPEVAGEEPYVPPSLVWNRIALRYKTRYVNDSLRIFYPPLPDALRSRRRPVKAPEGARLYYQEFVNLEYPFPELVLLRNYANYVRYSLHGKIGLAAQPSGIRSPLRWLAAFPMGLLQFLRDWWIWKRE
jgi:glycosyltransferase involved in cell wall biosynthesis